jgi:hypothetical protein
MQRLLTALRNRLLASLPAEDYGLIVSNLVQVDLERGRLLYDPGDPIETVYFPTDGVISLMTLMDSGAAIESATIGREGALGLSAAVAVVLLLVAYPWFKRAERSFADVI